MWLMCGGKRYPSPAADTRPATVADRAAAAETRHMSQTESEDHHSSPDPIPLVSFAEVPSADAAAVVDPHWLELRGSSTLPTVYMPPAMAGPRSPWLRLVALGLIAIFITATAAGVCLTYGRPSLFW